jgi:DNA-binding response OmpR family regulator
MYSGRVLIAEDPLVRKLIAGILAREGIAATQAEPQRAPTLLDEPHHGFTLLITNAPYLFADRGLDVPLLYLAAAPDLQWLAKFPRSRALHKPFRPHELVAVVRELLEGGRAAAF